MEPDFLINDNVNRGIAPLFDQPMGLLPQQNQVFNPQNILRNIITDRALNKVGNQVGINQLANVLGVTGTLGSVFGFGANPLALGIGALVGGIKNRYNAYKQTKRDAVARQSAATRGSVKDLQSRIDRGDFDGPGGDGQSGSDAAAAAAQDAQRGGQYG